MAGHALTPATRLWLGRPLPYQQPDRTQALLKVTACKHRPSLISNHQIRDIIDYYLRFRGAIFFLKVGYPRVTHPFAAILLLLVCLPEGWHPHNSKIARHACLIHAASVHSEPGSNPPKAFITLLKFKEQYVV